MKTVKSISLVAILCLLGFTACKNSNNGSSNAKTITVSPDRDTVHIKLTAGDQMKFDKDEIDIYSGQTVVLTFVHTGRSPKATLGHNFTLLTKGTSPARFAQRAAKFEKNDYIPENAERVIAHTALLGGGQSDTISFQAPDKGTYDYICTFPGHYVTMHGKLVVQ